MSPAVPAQTVPMKRRRAPSWLIAASLAVLAAPAQAASLAATVTDEAGRPLPDAVITLRFEAGGTPPSPAAAFSNSAEIDQKDEAFIPTVVVIPIGGSVTFRNSDRTRHHIYSFSPIRRFEMVQSPNEVSAPVQFDQAGIAAIGCNIHDHMSAYVQVTDAPWAKVTDASGQARIDDLPTGRFVATVWHPRLRPRSEAPTSTLVVHDAGETLTAVLSVLPAKRPRGRDY